MFQMIGAVIGLQCAIDRIKEEQNQLDAAKGSLTQQQFDEYMSMRLKRFEQEQKEAAIESRHKEMCEAIRSTSFWRFGA